MTLRNRVVSGMLMFCLSAVLLAAPAAADIKDFTLVKAIPADAAVVINARSHAGQEFVKTQMERVWATVEKQHFERDLKTLFRGMVQEQGGDLEEFDRQWQRFEDLFLAVDWQSLAEKEFAFGMKLGFPTPEFAFLFSAPEDKVAANFEAFEGILKALLEFAPEGEVNLGTTGSGASVTHIVSFPNAPIPIGSFMLAREKDVMFIGWGAMLPEQTMALLRGEAGQTIASTDRFKKAFANLPAPTDELVFFDTASFAGQLRALIEKAMSMDPGNETADPKVKELPGKIVGLFDIFEYIASVSTTDGMKTTSNAVVVFRPGAKDKALYKAMFSNPPLKQPLKYVPATAQNMSVWSGFSLKAVYAGVIDFIRNEAPNGEEMLAEWEEGKAELKEEMGLDFETDIIGWIGGAITTFSAPGPSAYSGSQTVFMLSVSDEAKANEMIGRLFAAVGPYLEQNNGMVDDAKSPDLAGFKVVVHPMLAMMPGFSQPTIGVKSGQLMLGSSESAIAAALATGEGKSPNFTTNERFQKEGLPLGENVVSASFSDLSKMGEEIGQVLQMAPMIGFAMQDFAQKPVGRTILSVLQKLGVVVTELNFYKSTCSVTTLDGDALHTKSVLNYQKPVTPGKGE